MNLVKQRVLITGAARGIGRATAVKLAAEGADLILLDVDRIALEELEEQLLSAGTVCHSWFCDLTNEKLLDETLNEIEASFGGVDVIINNAGVVYYGPTISMPHSQWEALLKTNLVAPLQITRRLLPLMQKRGGGHLVNVASIAGLIGFKRTAVYSLTKFAMVGFSESLRLELAKEGIGVTAVCPGFVQTDLYDAIVKKRRPNRLRSTIAVQPEHVASQIVRAIERNKPLIVIGWSAQIAWRFKRFSQRLFTAALGGYRKSRVKRSPFAEQPSGPAKPTIDRSAA